MAENDPTLIESIFAALDRARGKAGPYLTWLPDRLLVPVFLTKGSRCRSLKIHHEDTKEQRRISCVKRANKKFLVSLCLRGESLVWFSVPLW